jgi:hypothetical protein
VPQTPDQRSIVKKQYRCLGGAATMLDVNADLQHYGNVLGCVLPLIQDSRFLIGKEKS